MSTFKSQKTYKRGYGFNVLSSLRRLTRVRAVASHSRPKSFSGGTRTVNGVLYELHPTKGYRKVNDRFERALKAA